MEGSNNDVKEKKSEVQVPTVVSVQIEFIEKQIDLLKAQLKALKEVDRLSKKNEKEDEDILISIYKNILDENSHKLDLLMTN